MDATYSIGIYEVSNAEHTEFLNAVATTDTYGLYNTFMGAAARAVINRTGSSGSYTLVFFDSKRRIEIC